MPGFATIFAPQVSIQTTRHPQRGSLAAAVSLALLMLGAMACGPGDPSDSADSAAHDAAVPDAIDLRIDRLFGDGPGFGTLDRSLVRAMMTLPAADDGPFFMCNLIALRDRAAYPDGRETDLTGAEANALYGQLVLPILSDIGARPVFVAEVETQLQGDGAPWAQVGVVRYPSRAAFFDMLERDDFRAAAVHKTAGVARTLVMPAGAVDMGTPESFLDVDLESLPYPPTANDPPIAIVHLYDFREQAVYEDGRDTELTGAEAVGLYEQGRAGQGVLELGVRPALWLAIEGALYGDGRSFDELRVNLFPSRAAFAQVAATSEDAGIVHRTAGLADLYSMVTRPVLNEYGYR